MTALRECQSPTVPWKGRTSIGSVVARAILPAHSSAASRFGALTMQMPPTCSFPSIYGPVGQEQLIVLGPGHGRGTRGMEMAVENPDSGRLHLLFKGRHVIHDPVQVDRRRRWTVCLLGAEQVVGHLNLAVMSG